MTLFVSTFLMVSGKIIVMKKILLIVFFTLVFFATKFANAKEIQILCVPEMEE